MKPIIIDADVLCSPSMDGIHRYMLEILKRIDDMVPESGIDIRLIHRAEKTMPDYGFKNLTTVPLDCGNKKFRLSVIPKYVKQVGGMYCSMSNDVAMCPDSVITIMDVIPLYEEAKYPTKSKLKMKFYYSLMKKYGSKFITISETSREDIVEKLGIPREKIQIIGCGWDHMKDISGDTSIMDRFKIKPKSYYYAVGSQYPHKNFKWIKEVAKNNPESHFVIAGRVTNIDDPVDDSGDNVRYIGAVTDSENKTLMENAIAFLHPSFIEGFGLPPMEALSVGTPAVVSRITCLQEIYGNSVYYVDPYNYNLHLDDVVTGGTKSSSRILDNYKWMRAAKLWMKLLLQCARNTISDKELGYWNTGK